MRCCLHVSSGSILALVAPGNFLQNTAGEKKKLVEELEEVGKKLERKKSICKKKKHLQYFAEEEECFFDFLTFVKFLSLI